MLEKSRQLWRSDYVQLLEEEGARLRAENRALMNLRAAGAVAAKVTYYNELRGYAFHISCSTLEV